MMHQKKRAKLANHTRVIGVGFHKTGTSTLRDALNVLGYRVLGARKDLAKNIENEEFDKIFTLTDKYNAYQDNPWPLIFKELDHRYPNSKFILTIRDESKWIKSVVNHFGEKDTYMRKLIYGVAHPKGNEQVYLNRYRRHNEEVKEFFKDRSEDLLIVNWENGDGWNEICNFLKVESPDQPFPHSNKRASNKKPALKRIKSTISKTLRSKWD